MADSTTVLKRLREDDRHLRSLVQLGVDDLLQRPVSELVDPEWLAERLVEGFRASVEDERTKEWIRQWVNEARDRADTLDGSLRPHISPELVQPVKQLLRRPYTPDPEVIRQIFDHIAVRELVREVLQTTLVEYARSVKVPDAAKDVARRSPLASSRLKAWAGAASAAAKMVGSEVERRMEHRVNDYVDGAISRAIEVMVAFMCDPAHAGDWAAARADGVDVLLDHPLKGYAQEIDKLDPDALIDEIHDILRALSRSEGVVDQVRGFLQAVTDAGGERSARDFLDGSGLEEGWRPQLEALALERAQAFVATPAFEGWLADLLADG